MADVKAAAAPKKVKLYYTPTSCGVASFISAHKAGLKIDVELVDLKSHKTDSGADFYAINPKGNVPALVLSDGTVLNENVACLSWIADQNLSAGLAPANGTKCRYSLLSTMAWLTSELHPAMGGLFAPNLSEDTKLFIRGRAAKQLTYLDKLLGTTKQFIFGQGLTIADVYGHILVGWSAYVNIDLAPYPNVVAWLKRIKEHPDVVAAQKIVATKPSTL